MNNYEIQSQKLNPNKVFILQKSELEKSFSPLYHSSLPKKLAHAKKLKEVAIVNPTRPRPKFESNEIVPYVGLPETDEHSKSIVKVAMRPYKEVAGRNVIYPNELLFARIEPSVFNKKYILTEDLKGHQFAFTSTEFYVVKGKNVSNKFLMAAFHSDYVFNQIEGKTTGSTGRRRLDPEVFENLIIPIPEIEKQKKIETIYNSVVEQKKQNELESEKLLSSIDDYLLNELEIKLPKETYYFSIDDLKSVVSEPKTEYGHHIVLKDNFKLDEQNKLVQQKRIFTTSIKEISGGRFDPFFHQKHFDALKNPVSKFPTRRIKEINEEIKTGLPVRKDYRIEDGAYPYYGANGIIGYMDEYTHDGLYLVIGQDGYIGNHYVVKGKFWGSNHNWVLKLKNGYDYEYVKASLDVLKYDYLITGGVIPKLTKEALESIRIPVPPIEKQKEIADHITTIRNQAHQLTDKTNEAMKKASEEIEKILLQ